MKLDFEITLEEYRIVKTILDKHLENCKVYVFGSRAKNSTRFNSDLDLAIEGERPIDQIVLIDLKEAFNDSDLTYKVDLVDLKNIDQNFKQLIEKDFKDFK